MRCAELLDTIGVNIHLEYPATPYQDVARVLSAMEYCGIRFARDGAVYDRAPNVSHYGDLAARGIRFCFFWGPGRSMVDEMRQLDQFEAANPGAIDALEGPNEIKPRFAYAGRTAVPAAQAFMADMRDEAAKYDRLRRKPIVAFTGYSGYACDCDIANVHAYPKGGQQPGDILRRSYTRWVGPRGFMPDKRMVFTEFGYHTVVGKAVAPGWQGVDEATQAALLLNGWFAAADAGATRTYAYELFDETPDGPNAPQMQNRFGLFHGDGTPKLAATALRRLSTVLGDASPRARSFPTRPSPYSLEASPAVASVHLQDSTGRHYVYLTNTAPIWDAASASPLNAMPGKVSITLQSPLPITTWDLLTNSLGTELNRSRRVELSVTNHPIVIRLG